MANFSAEVQFAQNLASNEKKIRDKALKKLKKYLRLKSSSKGDSISHIKLSISQLKPLEKIQTQVIKETTVIKETQRSSGPT